VAVLPPSRICAAGTKKVRAIDTKEDRDNVIEHARLSGLKKLDSDFWEELVCLHVVVGFRGPGVGYLVPGSAPMDERMLRAEIFVDSMARVLELFLAAIFIFAVLLNFSNVAGRYLFGLSLIGSDEVQIYIMIGMTFVGAAVVTRRDRHLRMDVIARMLPLGVQRVLRLFEQTLLAILALFVIFQSTSYALRIFSLGRTSDMAGVPMWIPHGTVALGFLLVLLAAAWQMARGPRQPVEKSSTVQP
jgi:TRAP-type transport system small permease protein